MHSNQFKHLSPALGLIAGSASGILLGLTGWSIALLIIFGAGIGLVIGSIVGHPKPVPVVGVHKTGTDEKETHRG